MKVSTTAIPDVLLIEPTVHCDARGFFFESFNQSQFRKMINRDVCFVQDNHSCSKRDVLRGLHYQINQAQGKLVRVIAGEVFDVAVDIRKSSPTFGQWVAETLSADNKKQLWVPPGFAHGFLVLSKTAEILYKTTDFYSSADERCIRWNDPSLNISWPLVNPPALSKKDQNGVGFLKAEVFD